MKFSVRQILASAAGAVLAAVIASVFGVKGTIVGVAIGSAAATMGTALVAQSIDRGHQAVKQVAERVPLNTGSRSTLLHRLGGTRTHGDAASSVDTRSAPMDVVGSGAGGSGRPGAGSGTVPVTSASDETVQMGPAEAAAEETDQLEVSNSPAADAPATERLSASTMPLRRVATSSTGGGAPSASSTAATGAMRTSSSAAAAGPRRYSWKAIAAAAGIVFVLALLFITAVELISGKPLSDIFGGAGSGTSFGNVFSPSAPKSTSTTTPTSSPAVASTSTTAPTTSGSTSTTGPTGTSSTTTSSSPSTTTTTVSPGGSATTTTGVAGATSP